MLSRCVPIPMSSIFITIFRLRFVSLIVLAVATGVFYFATINEAHGQFRRRHAHPAPAS